AFRHAAIRAATAARAATFAASGLAPLVLAAAARRLAPGASAHFAARLFFLAALVAFRIFLAFDVFLRARDLRDELGASARARTLGRLFGVGVTRRFFDRQRLARAVLFIRGHTNPGECAKVGGIRRV
ncbi:hypothetical protein HMPREF0004_2069, partial [Achromobacter piechaudii ATCC 43553]